MKSRGVQVLFTIVVLGKSICSFMQSLHLEENVNINCTITIKVIIVAGLKNLPHCTR